MSKGKASGDTMADAHTDSAANFHTNDGTTAILMDDGVEVRLLNGGKKADMSKSDNGEFIGLRKEELAKYASDPYWVRLRVILLVIFALVWIAMLVAAIVIVALTPGCPPRPSQEWWENAVVYHIHPMSFQDSNGDGVGDIKGIHDRLDYLRRELKVTAVSLGPIDLSDFVDSGDDITQCHIAPCPSQNGSVGEFDDLRKALHKAGIKLILDFIPNHTSRQHQWFKASANETGDHDKFRDFYIWNAGYDVNGTKSPPNNLTSVRGNMSAWTLNEARGEYYYHSISANQPDLNLRNEKVRAQLAEALKVWLGRKVDGFTVRDAEYLVEPENITGSIASITFQRESYELMQEWRKIIDDFTQEESKSRSRKTSRVLIADVNGLSEQGINFSGYLVNNTVPGAHLITNKVLTNLTGSCFSQCVFDHINKWINISGNVASNWQVSSVDVSRLRSRTTDGYVNAVNLLMMTLGGTVTTLYGEELAMQDGLAVNLTSSRFKYGQLTPMLWNNSKNAGFTTPNADPWMVIADGYHNTSLQTQQAHGSGVNHFAVFQRLIQLRSDSESLQWGKLRGISVQDGVLLYMREAVGFNRLLIAINFGPGPSTVDFAEYESKQLTENCHLPDEMTIVSSTFNFKGEGRVDAYNNGTKIELNKMIYLQPTEGVVLSGPPRADCSD